MDDLQLGSGSTATNPFSPKPLMVLMATVVLIGLCAMFGGGLLLFAAQMRGMSLQEALDIGTQSSTGDRYFVRAALFLNQLTTFLLPASISLWLFYRRKWPVAASLHQLPNLGTLLLGLLFVMAAFPLAQVAFQANKWVVEQFPILESLVRSEKMTIKMMEGLLVMQTPLEMVASLVVMALVPALGEELVFRGIGQRKLIEATGQPAVGITLTALIFSITHFEIQRFLAILLLGGVLGLLFHWTKNLWLPIAAHFLHNGAQIVIAWLHLDRLNELKDGPPEELPVVAVLTSAVVFATTGFFLWKEKRDG